MEKYFDLFCAKKYTSYSNDRVNNSVKSKINAGNMTTLNCPEEIYLSNKLAHPWASMTKFTRGGVS